MKERPRRGHPSFAPLFLARCVIALLVATFLAGCGGGGSGDSRSSSKAQAQVNVVMRNNAPGVQTQGRFEAVPGYLSQSPLVLRSVDHDVASATFHLGVPQRGFYRLYAWWPQAVPAAGIAQVIVQHQGGETASTVDQRTLGGQWNALGAFELDPAGPATIVFRQAGTDPLLIDAVRFQFVGAQRPALTIATQALPIALKDRDYAATLDVTGGVPPYAYRLAEGALPPGLHLDGWTGVVSGMPALVGGYPFSIEATDAAGGRFLKSLTLDVLDTIEWEPAPAEPLPLTTWDRKHPADGPPAGTSPDLSNLLNILSALPEGEWSKINLNNFSDVWTPDDLRPLMGLSNPRPSTIILAWSSFSWDPNRGDLILFGGGHANYRGNDVYRWRGTTQKWERASLPSEMIQDNLGNWNAIDGADHAPASAHTYDNSLFFPLVDRMITFGGAADSNGGHWHRLDATGTASRDTGPYLFNPALADGNKVGGSTGSHVQRTGPHPEIVGGNMWANRDIFINIPNNPPLPYEAFSDGCTAYAQENGKDVAYIRTLYNLFKYTINDLANPVADTWEKVGIYWTGPGSKATCVYDPMLKVFVRTANNTVPFVYWNLNTPGPNNQDVNFTPTDPTGEFAQLLASNAISLRDCAFDFDPTRRQHLLWCGDGRVWALKPPATLSPTGWTINKQRAPVLSVPNGDLGTGILGKWKYISNLDAFMGLQDSVQGNIWVYKPVGWQNPQGGGGSNTPPSVSLTGPPNGSTYQSGTPITITATASDSDGTVGKVDFYNGKTLIGTVATAPYSFTWTTAPIGNLTLTAVATDNAGAKTASAPVTIIVSGVGGGTVVLQDGNNGYNLTRDTYLDSYHKTTSLGTATFMRDYITGKYTDLVQFAVFQSEGGPVPNGAIIQSAQLSLYKYTYYNMTYAVNRMLANWSEASATWQQRDIGLPWGTLGAQGAGVDYQASADAQASVGFNPGWVTFDVTTAIQQMSGGQPNYGWKLRGLSGYLASEKKFYTREYAADPTLRPKLVVSFHF